MSEPFSDLVPVRDFFTSMGVPCWFAGGWAFDLFVGERTRDHNDVNVLILDRDAESLHSPYAAGLLRLTHAHEPATWTQGEPLQPGRDVLEPSPVLVGNQLTHVVLGLTRGDDWVYHRGSQAITLPVTRLGRERDGLPYLVPEAALLFHARIEQSKGERAFNIAEPHLDSGQRSWLCARLPQGHRWQHRLSE